MLSDERIAELAKALGHPARVHIIRTLAAQSECSGAEIFTGLPLAQSTISEHLRVLREAGVVHSRPVGTSMVYCVDADTIRELALAVGEIAAATPTCTPAEQNRTC